MKRCDNSRADEVVIAAGFVGPATDGPRAFGLELNLSGTVKSNGVSTHRPNVFVAGDCKDGAELVVTAVADGKVVSVATSAYLTKARSVRDGRLL